MNDARADLSKLVRQLRVELEWASRIGIEVVAPLPSDLEPLDVGPALVPVEAGRPESGQASDLEAKGRQDGQPSLPPPAFQPDTEEERDPPLAARVSPEQARVRDAPQGRPWERYLPEESPSGEPTESSRPSERPHSSPQPSDGSRLAGASSLSQVREILGDCTRCKLHRAGRRQIVFGVGNPDADLMFIGEGPGRQEDIEGEPFVGEAGQLLTRIIESGMKLPRSQVYIANIVKCRPPRNRDPDADEVEACEPFLMAQIRQVRPKVIVALGKYAAQTLLRSSTPISRLRGRWHTYEGIDLMPTFHPAYLLRNPREKRAVWEDVQEVMKRLGTEPSRS